MALTQCIGAAGPRFVPQAELPEAWPTNSSSSTPGAVPTREGLHDFFNGLVWKRFPATKRLLNRLQAAEIEAAGVGQVRGAVRDAITLFDETPCCCRRPDALWEALIARRMDPPLRRSAAPVGAARLVGFGHAFAGEVGRALQVRHRHVYRAPVPPELGDDLAAWDDWLAARLKARNWLPSPSPRCLCLECRAGGRATKTLRSTTTPTCSGRCAPPWKADMPSTPIVFRASWAHLNLASDADRATLAAHFRDTGVRDVECLFADRHRLPARQADARSQLRRAAPSWRICQAIPMQCVTGEYSYDPIFPDSDPDVRPGSRPGDTQALALGQRAAVPGDPRCLELDGSFVRIRAALGAEERGGTLCRPGH